MKDSETTGRTSKKSTGRTACTRVGTSLKSKICNGAAESKTKPKRTQEAKVTMGAANSKTKSPTKLAKKSNTISPKSRSNGKKDSPEFRPRRRASQTYIIKYQLARNPLKAEEEDLKLALLASLKDCSGNSINGSSKLLTPRKQSKFINNDGVHLGASSKAKKGELFSENGNTIESIERSTLSQEKKPRKQKLKRRNSIDSNSSSGGSNPKEPLVKKLKKSKSQLDLQGESLSEYCNFSATDKKLKKPRSTIRNSRTGCNDLTVKNKIKKAKKLLQNKQAINNNSDNYNNNNSVIGKISALRKFSSNASLSPNRRKLLLSPSRSEEKIRGKNGTNCCLNNASTANSKPTSKHQTFIPYSPFTPLQKREPLDEEYLRKYRPETEDFLTFICFRATAPNYHNPPVAEQSTSNGHEDDRSSTATPTNSSSNSATTRYAIKQEAQDHHDFRYNCSSSRLTSAHSGNNFLNESSHSPNNNRRPTRHSPRLASTQKKISENDVSNHNMGTTTTAYNSGNYFEDMKKASIALEDMAQEINSSDGTNNELAQNSNDCISKSSSPYKNNKHLVKGLMTREFAGAFADEETIFESLPNHKL